MPTSIPTLLDVTLRDGGYVNRHAWSIDEASRIVEAAARAGIPGVEVGYFRPRRHGVDGHSRPAASCPPLYLDRLSEGLHEGGEDRPSIVVMVHQQDVTLAHYRELAARGVATVRLPTKISALDRVHEHVAAIHDAGMRAALNIIRISELNTREIATAAATAQLAGADVFYLADSNGSLFPSTVTELVGVVRGETDRPVGFHAHDGLSLAFGNSLAALDAGCRYLDASLNGMGKGGGNLSLELISGYLRARLDAPIDISPLAYATNEVLAPWRGGGALVRCESIVSSLLNLNLDDIAGLRGEGERGVLDLLGRYRKPQPVLPS
jgi:4-hydroxy 2-oxovalerate aldolase